MLYSKIFTYYFSLKLTPDVLCVFEVIDTYPEGRQLRCEAIKPYQLMLRADDYVRQPAAGLYIYLPLCMEGAQQD